MNESKRMRALRGGRAKRLGCVLLFAVLGATALMGQAHTVVSAAELLTSKQHLWVNVRTMDKGVRIYLDQVEACDARVLNMPKGFTAVANIQIFDHSRLDAIAADNNHQFEYANAIAALPKDSTTEVVSFDPPMIIILGNPDGVDGKTMRFGLLVNKDTKKDWLIWDTKKESKPELKEKFKKIGFVGDFLEGDLGVLVVYKWPSGDPSVCH